METKEMGKYSKNCFIETAKDHFETIMLPKLTEISEKVVRHTMLKHTE